MKTTYQLVVPATAPGLPARHFFTRDVTQLNRATVGTVIIVLEMTDEDYAAVPASPESAAFFA